MHRRTYAPGFEDGGDPGFEGGLEPGMSSSNTTTDHDEIKQWAEDRGGKPARVKDAGGDGDLIRLMFPDAKQADDDGLEEIEWDRWFENFEENKLALIYQDETADGEKRSFNKLVSR